MISKIIDGNEENVAGSGVNLPVDADKINYDNTESELQSTNVQDAIDEVADALDDKVDKIAGKSLSTNDYTNEDKAKLDIDTHTLEGNPLSFTTDSAQVAKDAVVTIEPIQAGSGDPSPSNERPISGYDSIEVLSTGKNIWGGEKFADDIVAKINGATKNTTNKTVSFEGVYASDVILFDKFIPNTQYTVMYRTESGYYMNMKIKYTDNTETLLSAQGTGRYVSDSSKSIKYICGVFQSGAMIYYDEVGVFVGDVSAEEFEQYNPYQNLQLTLGQTVYGGTLDVETGVLTVDRKIDDLSNYTWNNQGGIIYRAATIPADAYYTPHYGGRAGIVAEQYKDGSWGDIYDSGKDGIICMHALSSSDKRMVLSNSTGTIAGKFVYRLETPFTIQLTPHEISLLQGINNVSTTADSIKLTYSDGVLATLEDVKQVGESVEKLGDVVSSIFSKRVPLTQDFVAPGNGIASIYVLQNQSHASSTSVTVNEDNTTVIYTRYIDWPNGWGGETLLVPLLKGHTYNFSADTSPASVNFNDNKSYFIY